MRTGITDQHCHSELDPENEPLAAIQQIKHRYALRVTDRIADGIHFDGCQMRRDIGYRAIGRK